MLRIVIVADEGSPYPWTARLEAERGECIGSGDGETRREALEDLRISWPEARDLPVSHE